MSPAASWLADQDGAGVAGAGGSRPARLAAARRRAGRESGSSAIELAMLAPLLLALIWMTIQYALYYQGRQVALAAAQLGARYASQYETSQPGWQVAAQLKTENYYQGLGTKVLGPHITANAYISGPGQVRVTVTGSAASILLGLNLTIHETAGAPIECFRPYADGGQNC